VQADDEFDWFEDVSDAHLAELQRFRRAIRRAGDQFGFYVFVARKSLHDALIRQAVQAGIDECRKCFTAELVEDDDLREWVEELLRAEGAMHEGLVVAGDVLVEHDDGSLMRSINVARERLASAILGPLVLCVTEAACGALPDLASDLWSARSGVFSFDAEGSIRTRLAIGEIANAKGQKMQRVGAELIEVLAAEAERSTPAKMRLGELAVWGTRFRMLGRSHSKLPVSLRFLRQSAERAEQLGAGALALRFREAELMKRRADSMPIRSTIDAIDQLLLGPQTKLDRIVALGTRALVEGNTIDELLQTIRIEAAQVVSEDTLSAALECVFRGIGVLGVSPLVVDTAQDLRKRVRRRRYFLTNIADELVVAAWHQLGDDRACALLCEERLSEARRCSDFLAQASWLRQRAQLDQAHSRATFRQCWAQIRVIAKALGLDAMRAAAEAAISST
jgi:hypothetical protein